MIDKFYCPCCGEERPLPDYLEMIYPGMLIECQECGTIYKIEGFAIFKEADD